MRRIVVLCVCLSLLTLLMGYYALTYEEHKEYPTNEEVVRGVEGTVSIGGVVIGAETIRIEYGSSEKEIIVHSDDAMNKGDFVEILGVLHGNEIVPEKIIVYEKWSYYGIFIRSAIVIPIMLYLFFRYWIFDTAEMIIRRREHA